MKRSEALISLSRDHHRVLGVAQRLRRSEDPEDAALFFLVFWEREGKRHFREEEEVLMPMWAALGTVDEEHAARLALEHRQIREAAIVLRSGRLTRERIEDLASVLDAHVRFEERELFCAIEEDLGPRGLDRLAEAVAAAEVDGCSTQS